MTSFEEIINKMAKPYEVKAMADVIIKETNMLTARAKALKMIAEHESNGIRVIEINAEIAMISRIIDLLLDMTDETFAEAEKLGMTK